jgi:hypothetical protein
MPNLSKVRKIVAKPLFLSVAVSARNALLSASQLSLFKAVKTARVASLSGLSCSVSHLPSFFYDN